MENLLKRNVWKIPDLRSLIYLRNYLIHANIKSRCLQSFIIQSVQGRLEDSYGAK